MIWRIGCDPAKFIFAVNNKTKYSILIHLLEAKFRYITYIPIQGILRNIFIICLVESLRSITINDRMFIEKRSSQRWMLYDVKWPAGS